MQKKTYDFSNKPYNRCLFCDHRGVSCDGPRTSAMDLNRWMEYMSDLKAIKGFTISYISEKSGVSMKTVERIMTKNTDQGIMRETARAIEHVLIGSSNQYPCYLAFLETVPESKRVEEAEAEMALLRANIGKIHESYNAELEKVREEAQKKIDYLLKDIAKKDAIIDKLLEKR